MLVSLRQWILKASKAQIESLAKFAETSPLQLRQLGLGYRRGSADLAVRVHRASTRFPSLPNVSQESICPACAECPYRQAAIKKDPLTRPDPLAE